MEQKTTSRPSDRELRCSCGALMARVTAAGVELKCRRCKRAVLIPLHGHGKGWMEVPLR